MKPKLFNKEALILPEKEGNSSPYMMHLNQ